MMKETKSDRPFDWGVFFVNTSPFLLALIIALGVFRSVSGAFAIGFVCPLFMLATLIPIVFCLRPGLPTGQRVITIFLDVVALGFFGFMSWSLFMLWRVGPLTH
jgi:hypothetical protein